MSLLNEMLKDLNENKNTANSIPVGLPSRTKSFTETAFQYFPWVLAILIVSLFIVLLVHAFHLAKQKPSSSKPTFIINAKKMASTLTENMAIQVLSVSNQKTFASQDTKQADKALNTPLSSKLTTIPEMERQSSPGKQEVADKEQSAKEHMKKTFNRLTAKEWHDVQFNRALEALEEENEHQAMRILTHLLSKLPDSVNARESLAALYLSQGQFNQAMKVLNDGLALEPRSLVLNSMKARLLFEQDKAFEALTLLNPFHPNIHANPDFYGLKAAILQTLGHIEEAGGIYKVLVEVAPMNGQYWLGYAIALEQKQAFQQAAMAYQRASESYETDDAIRGYAESRLHTLRG